MQQSRRLTDYFLPDHYDLSLDIDRAGRTFSGAVTITGTAQQTGSLWLHAKELSIDSCRIDGESVEIAIHENDELELQYAAQAQSEYALELTFTAKLTDQMHGMYPCYFEHDDTAKELVATQFESHHAREVFPCVDEPAAKATFDLTLVTENGVTVLGNMPVTSQQESGSRLTTTFERTPKMSTYLLAWVYGELHSKSATTTSGVEVNIWATPAQSPESLDFALDIATRTIDFFDDYFGVKYPLPKCDHVALPDFSSGAMENWGLITYREVALLADPKTTSISAKHRIAAVIAHELSHQWFGNLVTMTWWNNLWLNESFANLMEYIALDAIEPSWNVWFEFASYETVMSLRRDATDGVQAVQVAVNHPDEISTLFDPAIVYAKGSRLLRMLERYMGSDYFRDGLRQYFKQHAYSNTVETDLWDALASASGLDIKSFMTPWITQPGYPVVTVSETGLTQQQFFIGDHQASNRLWPVSLGSSDKSLPKLLEQSSLAIQTTKPFRLNIDDSAHYITLYPESMLASHLKDVQSGALDPVGRLQLLHEQTLLARGQLVSTATLIPMLGAYKAESTESVWDIMAIAISEMKKFVDDDNSSEQALRAFARSLATEQYERLGWTMTAGEPEADTKLRATIIGTMIYGEDAGALKTATELANGDINVIDPELRAVVLGAAIKHAPNDELFNTLLDLHRTTSSAELQQDIASGLTSTKNPKQIDTLISLLTDSKTIRSQDVARWFVYLIRNKYSHEQAWTWMKSNWSWIETTFAGDKSYDDYPKYSAMGMVKQEQLDDYIKFFEPLKSQKALVRVIDMGASEIKARVDLIESDRDAVRQALLNQK